MKRFFKLFVLVIGIFLISGCSKGISDVSFKEFKNLINDKETFVLFVSSKDCSNCTAFEPKFKKVVSDNGIDNVKKIDLSTLSEKEQTEFDTYLNVSGTPNVIFINKGEEESTLNRINGNVSETKIKERFKANNYIK